MLHRKVQHLSLQVFKTGPDPVAWIPYVEQLAAKAPHITNLALQLSAPARDCEDQVISLIRGLPALRRIVLHPYCLTTKIATALSRLDHLIEIASTSTTMLGNTCSYGDVMDVMHFMPQLLHSPEVHDTAFPQLRNLTFSARVEDAEKFMAQLSAVDLKSLCIHIIAVTPRELLEHLFWTISTSCRSLTVLHVKYVPSHIAPGFQQSHAHVPNGPLADYQCSSRPSIHTFRPLFACTKITTFGFRWNVSLDFSQEDVEEFASSWPQLEVLLLNCEPTGAPNSGLPTLTLTALFPFARHCPNMRQLGLYFDATDVHRALLFSRTEAATSPPFAHLEKLVVAASPIDNPELVALFLSRICPLTSEIDADVLWSPTLPSAFGGTSGFQDFTDEESIVALGSGMTQAGTAWIRWREVGRLLRMAVMARMDERERLRGIH